MSTPEHFNTLYNFLFPTVPRGGSYWQLLYAFFWVIPRCLNFISRRFGTLCLWRWNRQCSETSAYQIQTPGNYPKESSQHSEHGERLKSRILTTSLRTRYSSTTSCVAWQPLYWLVDWAWRTNRMICLHVVSFWGVRWNRKCTDYTLITNLMHWLLFIHKILFSSTCFEHQVLIFRRT